MRGWFKLSFYRLKERFLFGFIFTFCLIILINTLSCSVDRTKTEKKEAWYPKLVELAGLLIPYISEIENIVFLAAHGAVHQWYRLFWLKDISVLIEDEISAAVEDIKKYDKIVLNGYVKGIKPFTIISVGVDIRECSFIELIDEVDLSVSATEFNELVIENYAYQIIEVSGVVYSANVSFGKSIKFEIPSPDLTTILNVDSDTDISDIVKGDSITVRGLVINKWDGGYELVNCIITKDEE